jgi:diaminopimelate epimerase
MVTRFFKYHALGNDYLVLNPSELAEELDAFRVQRICHRNFGVGSDGILLGPLESKEGDFGLRIFNPDGSEAEKSGNGLRIFSRYLWDQGLVKEKPFTVMTPGGKVESTVMEGGRSVTVQMGQVSFDSTRIPVKGAAREVLNETMVLEGEKLLYCAATVGNPHCVVLREEVSEELARRLGPLIEKEPRFPNRTNVQFMKVLDRSHIQIEIWERGAGYTLASGSSSSAAAAVAYRLGLCGSQITVRMPGGDLDIRLSEDFSVQMTGPVTKIAEGTLFPEMFDS